MALVDHVDDAILEATEPSYTLTDEIRTGYQIAKNHPPLEQDDMLRVSGLYRLCPREEALRARLDIDRVDAVGPDTRLVFDHGKGLHHVLQNYIFGELGTLFGVWRCTCAGLSGTYDEGLQGVIARPQTCHRCGDVAAEDNPIFTYIEPALVSEKYKLRGHCDGYLRVADRSDFGVAEFKSANDARFKEAKKRPQEGHFIQIQAYMLLTGLTWGVILYWNKSKDGVIGLAEHRVYAHERTQKTLVEKVRLTFQHLDTGPLPQGVCDTPQCNRADACPVRDACFSEGADERYGALSRCRR